MKTFSDRWRQLEWDDIRLRINSKTAPTSNGRWRPNSSPAMI